MTGPALSIEIFSDVICPWCYIGKRRFERALAERPATRVDIRWRAFMLNPDMPAAGMERGEYLQRKFGSASRARDLYASIAEAGAAEGLTFAFDRIPRTPSTVKAHRMIAAAGAAGRQDAVVEALFRAYFEDGRDIGDDATLIAVATGAGLAEAEASGALEGDSGDDEVHADNAIAHAMGIGGVPCFIVAGRYAIAGAQDPEVFKRLIDSVGAAGLAAG